MIEDAATLSFTGGGATPIEAGDIVYQATGRGTVLGTPILESGSWTVGGNATGTILLNKISVGLSDFKMLGFATLNPTYKIKDLQFIK